jgi:glycosyltransferase involved in cell wall biosynthesis
MESVLSYFRSYFDPGERAPFENHSAGQIACHLFETLNRQGTVRYFGSKERPAGLQADLFVGHFYAFEELARQNDFRKRIAFYSISDPVRRRRLLESLAAEFGVPLPDWDFPPASFDHEATLELADLVLLVGNSYTLETFPERWRHKIRLLNYAVDHSIFRRDLGVEKRNEFCYVATNCGLRKGFMDILEVWRRIDRAVARLHVIGEIEPPWDELLARSNNGSVTAHGWIDSHEDEYVRLLQSCKFAHIPTYEEGQMGTLLEAIYSGCIPITTRASGIDDRVLEQCIVIEPRNIQQQVDAIHRVLAWTEDEYRERSQRLIQTAEQYQNWSEFEQRVTSAIVGQIGNLPPIVKSAVACEALPNTPITNRRQVTNLPHKGKKSGVEVLDGFLPTTECDAMLQCVAQYRNTRQLPVIHRQQRGRSLHYMVIDGVAIQEHFPQLAKLNADVNSLVNRLNGEKLAPLGNPSARININITPPAGEYRWHYDRNRVTAILYLNEVAGGETEMFPNYRLYLGRSKHTRLQRWLDSLLMKKPILWLFGKKLTIAPRKGMLIVMHGDRCLHSVRRVEGVEDRINIIMTFDAPGAVFPVEKELDSYLYSKKSTPAFDPNYQE